MLRAQPAYKTIFYANEFPVRTAFNSQSVFLFLAAATFVRMSSQHTPQGKQDGKFQNTTI